MTEPYRTRENPFKAATEEALRANAARQAVLDADKAAEDASWEIAAADLWVALNDLAASIAPAEIRVDAYGWPWDDYDHAEHFWNGLRRWLREIRVVQHEKSFLLGYLWWKKGTRIWTTKASPDEDVRGIDPRILASAEWSGSADEVLLALTKQPGFGAAVTEARNACPCVTEAKCWACRRREPIRPTPKPDSLIRRFLRHPGGGFSALVTLLIALVWAIVMIAGMFGVRCQ